MSQESSHDFKFKRDLSHVFDSVHSYHLRNKCKKRNKLIRVYTGYITSTGAMGHSGIIQGAFEDLRLLEDGWTIEYLSSKNIRENFSNWTHPKFLVDWFLFADMYVISCQGIHSGMLGLWNPTDCRLEIQRLEFHCGFPSGSNLRCPAFTGDKYEYILAGKPFTIPSFKIPLQVASERQLREIALSAQRFMAEHSNGNGWILKAPYVQNAQGFSVRTIKDIEGLKVHLYNICIRKDASRSVNKVGVPIINIFEYLILQPCLNRAESKVILLGGKAQFVVSTGRTCLSKKVFPDKDLFAKAEAAANHLALKTLGAFLNDGMVRVDFFADSNGQLVVNEFENLDATYYRTGKGNFELKTRTFLSDYYKNKFSDLIKTLH